MLTDTARALDALNAIPSTIDHDTRARVGMAAKDAGVTFDDYDAWQATNPRYNAVEVRSMWHSYDDGPVKAGTLYKIAAEHGYRMNGKSQRPAPERMRKPVEQPRKPAPGMAAAEVWERFAQVKSHPYATRKKLADAVLASLRVVPDIDPLTHYRGWLAVPGYTVEGELQTIEFVPPEVGANKMTLKGSTKSGAMFSVGPNDGGIVVVEGMATASAVYAATGLRCVSTFGTGGTRKVIEALRQKEPNTHITIAPDRGKEIEAQKLATEYGCALVYVPECEPNNTDLNDIYCRDGYDVVQALLDAATEPPKPALKVHPLAQYVDFDGTVKPPRWVIPGFIGDGVTVIAGAGGVGKTTALLPLALTAAGLHGGDLMPRQWRHVVYVTEDVDQAKRIVAGIVGHGGLGISLESARERMHLVAAVRLDPAFVASVGKTYREQFTRTVEGVPVLPLVVLDTKSAVLALENENDNSEASSMMAALKQGFDGLPVWLIGHVAKPIVGRNDVASLSARGAGATGDDGNGTVFLVREGENRYLVLGKRRFEPLWEELEIISYTAQTPALDEFGNVETVVMRWGIAAPAQQSRKEAAEQAAEQQRKEDEASLRQDIRDVVEVAWQTGNPLNREGVKAKSKRKHSEAITCLEALLSEQWLLEVFVPAKERLHPRKSSFFVNLTTEEHEAALSGRGLPAAKLAIPDCWKKTPVSIMPDVGHGCTKSEGVDHDE